eukprot:3589649-Rhodomonas_salina.2
MLTQLQSHASLRRVSTGCRGVLQPIHRSTTEHTLWATTPKIRRRDQDESHVLQEQGRAGGFGPEQVKCRHRADSYRWAPSRASPQAPGITDGTDCSSPVAPEFEQQQRQRGVKQNERENVVRRGEGCATEHTGSYRVCAEASRADGSPFPYPPDTAVALVHSLLLVGFSPPQHTLTSRPVHSNQDSRTCRIPSSSE